MIWQMESGQTCRVLYNGEVFTIRRSDDEDLYLYLKNKRGFARSSMVIGETLVEFLKMIGKVPKADT